MSPDPGGAVYGTITVGALLAAESAQKETYLETVGAVVLTLLLYVLAHSYSEYTGHRLKSGEPLTLAGFGQTVVHEAGLLAGACVPLIALLISWAAGASLSAAVSTAVRTSAAMVLVLEIIVGVRAGESGRQLAAQIAIGALLGLLVIGLRIVLH